MSADDSKKYVKPQVKQMGVVRGALYGRPHEFAKKSSMGFTTLEFELEREMHAVFCAMEGEDGTVPSRGVQDIRQHSQHPWRVLARRLREAHAAGVPKHQLHEVVHVLQQYVTRLGVPRARKEA